nr:cysteine desulfurase family protein [Streptococcus oricebi]
MIQVLEETFGNPSSTHSHGRAASKILRQARSRLAQLLNCQDQDLIFTSGGTESNNLAIKGYALAHQNRGKHLITTAIEHHSVLDTIQYLVDRFGFEASYIKPKDGKITAQQVQEALRPDTILVSTMYANNETGYLLPIQEISQLLKDHPAAYHVDAVQVMGKLPINLQELGVDFLSASAHKFHGPKGVGFLYAKQVQFDKLLHGGSQENKRRAGTENLAAIQAMVVALEESLDNYQDKLDKVEGLRQEVLSQLEQDQIDFYLNQAQPQLPHIINIGFPKVTNDSLLLRLDLAGISISTGSACTAGTIEPSHVLAAFYGPNSTRLTESVRISLSDQNSLAEMNLFVEKLKEILGG